MTISFFSDNLRQIRKFKKISLESLAEALSISKSAISDYENDKFSPSLIIARKMADFFGVSINDLEYSEILEKNQQGEIALKKNETTTTELLNANEQITILEANNKDLTLELKLQKQKVESLQIQLRLHDQLRDSKLSEIELLKTQVRLLEDKIMMQSHPVTS